MRGRKPNFRDTDTPPSMNDKKRIPEWGDGNAYWNAYLFKIQHYKKRIPEWGDGNKTQSMKHTYCDVGFIKKESPNEGTETQWIDENQQWADSVDKKRIPEWGDGNHNADCPVPHELKLIKKESPNEGTETYLLN